MKVLMLASEVIPFAKTGGLADVAGTLPMALKKLGLDISIALPYYKSIKESDNVMEIVEKDLRLELNEKEYKFSILSTEQPFSGIKTYFIDYPEFFDRDSLYGNEDMAFDDNLERFSFFCLAVLKLVECFDVYPDIIHLNDWHTGLVIPYLNEKYREKGEFLNIRTLFTIHNLGYHGFYHRGDFKKIDLPDKYLNKDYLGEDDGFALIKGGFLADVVNTVSPTYAKEITTPEYGNNLEDDLLRIDGKLYGVLNGIDYDLWNPQKDTFIIENFSINDLSGKSTCKNDIQREFGLSEEDFPLYGMVSRLATQKGIDILCEALPDILHNNDIQFAILGTGEVKYHNELNELVKQYPEKMAVKIEYNNTLAHKIYAGSDVFLVPSRYEPCGLSQMISMTYGTVPLVRKTGGLADTVFEKDVSYKNNPPSEMTGFVFNEYNAEELTDAIERAMKAYGHRRFWDSLRKNCMKMDFSWNKSAREYLNLYKKATISK
jgi:starch synthase